MHRLKHFVRVAAIAAAILCAGPPQAWAVFNPPVCKNAFTEQQEITEGNKVAAQVYQQMPVLPDSSPVSRYVSQLGMKLVSFAPGYHWPYNFHVVDSEDINAFALPGGSVFVNLGTVRAAETEAQLAGVMAHEISHVVMRHATCNITKQQAPRMGFGIASVLSQVLLGNSALGTLAQAGLGMGANLTFLRMSRDDEKQADLLGTDILYDAGYDPRGLPQFFETIQAKYGSGGAQFLSDHPNPGNRTEYVNAEIATLPPRSNPRVTSPEFTRIHALAMNEKVYTAKEVQDGAWRQTGHYAVTADGPGQIVNAPTDGPDQSGATSPAVRLGPGALGLRDPLASYRGQNFSVKCPSSWQSSAGQNGNVAFVPTNGSGQGGIAYGVIVDSVQPQGGVTNAGSLTQATTALVQQLSQQNGGLTQLGQISGTKVGGRIAQSVMLSGTSPVVQNGKPLTERDWLVTVARPDGNVSYLIFIAPEPDFSTLRPVFDSMLKSFRVQ